MTGEDNQYVTELKRQLREETARREAAERRLAFLSNGDKENEAGPDIHKLAGYALMESIPIPVFFKDRSGVYLGCNPAFEQFLGRSRSDLIGKTVYDIAPPDLADLYHEADEDLYQEGGLQIYEARVETADGGPRDVVFHKAVFKDSQGGTAGLIGAVFDITDRKRVESELVESERIKDAILQATTEMVLAMDLDGTIRLINATGAAQYGLTREDMEGASIYDFMSAKLGRALRAQADSVLETKTSKMVHDQRKGMRFETIISPVCDEDGTVEQILVVARDVTDRHVARERERQHTSDLAHIMRVATMGEMATLLAHELNQPFAAIYNYARGILRRQESGNWNAAEMVPVINEICDEAERGGYILRRVRAHIRKGVPARTDADINEIVATALALGDMEITQGKVEIQTEFAKALPPISVDPIEIEQVILNLLRNAVEALSWKPDDVRQIAVRTERDNGGGIKVSVSDNGPGIPPEMADRVFEPFVTCRPEGLGMGLPICRTIIEGHGGKLWMDGATGKGTIFHFVLPKGN